MEARDAVRFEVVDITVPRSPAILALTGGSTALPVMDLHDGRSLKESMVLMNYLHDSLSAPGRAGRPVRPSDAYLRALEDLLVTMAGPFIDAGYRFVMNQDAARRDALRDAYLAQLEGLDRFLDAHARGPTWFGDEFGWAEIVFTPFFQRFWFIEYYESVGIPDTPEFAHIKTWRDACVAHPNAQQTSREEIIKLYYDYARGAGNGALPESGPGVPPRRVSTFSFEPDWRQRPWPPQDKYGPGASDEQLGLV